MATRKRHVAAGLLQASTREWLLRARLAHADAARIADKMAADGTPRNMAGNAGEGDVPTDPGAANAVEGDVPVPPHVSGAKGVAESPHLSGQLARQDEISLLAVTLDIA